MTELYRVLVIQDPPVETHHYFCVNLERDEIMRDNDGNVMVWTDRTVAEAAVRERWPNEVTGSIGMGDTKWALFQAEMPYVLVTGGSDA